MPEHANRLIHETSPYLLQHAHNPVDWYPWCDQAFAEARRRNVPVFLSIGYSSCHWCHVMERESFEDGRVAELLNANFVSIKVDREERPDVDHLYMSACTALTGKGGWPLSCFLTPERKPFFAGTYFPCDDRGGMRGFITVLGALVEAWKRDRERLVEASENVLKHLVAAQAPLAAGRDQNACHAAFRQLEAAFDRRFGGFSPAPKFPSVHNLLFLIRYGLLFRNDRAMAMVDDTLQAMRRGGIFDHIGGGFCRYSTDERWLVPHFEKMMYDNALLCTVYCEAGAAINEQHFATARRILEYCLRDMRDPGGGFYTAQDADSEGQEGRYYVFTPDELNKVLGSDDGRRFCRLFNITTQGNFEGASIPNLIGVSPSEQDLSFAEQCIPRVLRYRQKRVPPLKDDKMLASVNGLMLVALSTAGRLMREPSYVAAAEAAGRFIMENMFSRGRLHASCRNEVLRHPATSEDYAYVTWGLLELYQATLKSEWLKHALHMAGDLLRFFADPRGGTLFLSGFDVADLPLRAKSLHDGALPSGNAVAALTLARLARITERDDLRSASAAITGAMSGEVTAYPLGFTGLLCAHLYREHGGTHAAITHGTGLHRMMEAVQGFNPFATAGVCGRGGSEMGKLAPRMPSYASRGRRATAYVCTGTTCLPPVTDPAAAAAYFQKITRRA